MFCCFPDCILTHMFPLSLSSPLPLQTLCFSSTYPTPYTRACTHAHDTSPYVMQCKVQWLFFSLHRGTVDWSYSSELVMAATVLEGKFLLVNLCLFPVYFIVKCWFVTNALYFVPRLVLFLFLLGVVRILHCQKHQNKNYHHLIIHASSFK